MIYAKRIVPGLNRFYRGHFQNVKTFFGYAAWHILRASARGSWSSLVICWRLGKARNIVEHTTPKSSPFALNLLSILLFGSFGLLSFHPPPPPVPCFWLYVHIILLAFCSHCLFLPWCQWPSALLPPRIPSFSSFFKNVGFLATFLIWGSSGLL